jgi:hypothetical protein
MTFDAPCPTGMNDPRMKPADDTPEIRMAPLESVADSGGAASASLDKF